MDGPRNIEAEQALLGAVLYDNSALPLAEGLARRHFADPFHGMMWADISELVARGQLADPVILNAMYEPHHQYREIGGMRYLADLVDHSPMRDTVTNYAHAVIDAATRREIVAFGHKCIQAGRDPREAPMELLGHVSRWARGLQAEASPGDNATVAWADGVGPVLAAMTDGRPRGRMTGLRCIDRRLGGLRPGMLIIIGGRPGMGKTALARAIAHGAAVRNPDCDVLFEGLEMGPEEMLQRELSALTYEHDGLDGVAYQDMVKGRLEAQDKAAIERAAPHIPPNVFQHDASELSVDQVRRRVFRMQRRRPLAAVVIDYLQLMQRPDARGRNEATVLGEMTAALKQLARAEQTCVVLLSQLSRQVESRDDKRPQLADLRESGAIEQDADAVLFPYREAYYLERVEPPPDRLELVRFRLDVICAKQRQGPTGVDRQDYRPAFDSIRDLKE